MVVIIAHTVKVINATELIMVTMTNFMHLMLYIVYHNKKKVNNKSTSITAEISNSTMLLHTQNDSQFFYA